MSVTERERTTVLLRAMADLIEAGEEVPVPYIGVNFVIYGAEDATATVAAIASALPCDWRGGVRANTQNGKDYYELTTRDSARKAQVTVAVPVADVCTEAGTRTVTDWQPAPAIAALLASTKDEAGETA